VSGQFIERYYKNNQDMRCLLKLNEVWFHDHNCKSGKSGFQANKIPSKGGPIYNGPGYALIPAPEGENLEELRSDAYSNWLDSINQYQQPGQPRPFLEPGIDEATGNPNKIGTPPGQPILIWTMMKCNVIIEHKFP
jgi:hypothetical protein